MAKHYLTDEQMEQIQSLFVETKKQSKVLDEILLCLKGSESMNIEGVIPAQKRMQRELENTRAYMEEQREELQVMIDEKVHEVESRQDKLQETVNSINRWKDAMTIYVGLLTSRKLWSIFAIFIVGIGLIVLIAKFGFIAVWQYVKEVIF
jgi:hypothetical protein